MKLVDFSIRRPVSVTIFAVAAVVFGLVAFGQLATDLLPDISYPSLTVQTTFAGPATNVVPLAFGIPGLTCQLKNKTQEVNKQPARSMLGLC